MGTVAIVDYGVGNLKSVANALSYLGCSSCITADPAELERADAIILPGVGAFPDAADRLRSGGAGPACAGPGSEEAGAGHLPGDAAAAGAGAGGAPLSRSGGDPRHSGPDTHPKQAAPHWMEQPAVFHHSPLFRGLDEGAYVYFVHSFSAQDTDPAQVIAVTDYGPAVTAAVSSGNFYGTQFHPEKSGEVGLTILRNFAGLNC